TVRSSIPELIGRSSVNGSARPPSASQTTPTKRRRQPDPAPTRPPSPSEPAQSALVPSGHRAPATSPTDAARPAPSPQLDGPAYQRAQAAGGRGQMTQEGWRRFFRQRPKLRHGRESVPVPAGQTMYESLKTSFVDFPRLITTLEREGHTGYVRLLTENANGL